ncbi:winged helix DNA-binding domain-containing protein [Gordonia sp. CPCC 205515]|uniref:winged helix DNA-binding domain-containing protein n=1 Tax=Gordonia sp. CPCC 205515 TaxID=3140791 RepID=UPI003AF378A3
MADQITLRQWNRTLLHRQHLLRRVDEDAIEVLDRCVGLQAQDPKAPFYGLWSRITEFRPAELDALLTEREVVRIALLRGTVFLVDGEDARWMRPAAQPVLDAALVTHSRRLVRARVDDILRTAAELLTDTPVSASDLGQRLARAYPGEDTATLVTIARCGLPLVQVPPRGLWAGRGAPTYTLLDAWIGDGSPAVTGDEARKDLIRLYLRGFGPATVKSIQTWCGLTRMRPLIEAMESDWELVTLAGPDGAVLYDLEGLDIIDEDTEAPPRLIAPYDNILVAQADRRRIADEDLYRSLQTTNGISPGFVLVDGLLAGTWGFDDARRVSVRLDVEPRRRERAALDEEVQRLQDFCDGS